MSSYEYAYAPGPSGGTTRIPNGARSTRRGPSSRDETQYSEYDRMSRAESDRYSRGTTRTTNATPTSRRYHSDDEYGPSAGTRRGGTRRALGTSRHHQYDAVRSYDDNDAYAPSHTHRTSRRDRDRDDRPYISAEQEYRAAVLASTASGSPAEYYPSPAAPVAPTTRQPAPHAIQRPRTGPPAPTPTRPSRRHSMAAMNMPVVGHRASAASMGPVTAADAPPRRASNTGTAGGRRMMRDAEFLPPPQQQQREREYATTRGAGPREYATAREGVPREYATTRDQYPTRRESGAYAGREYATTRDIGYARDSPAAGAYATTREATAVPMPAQEAYAPAVEAEMFPTRRESVAAMLPSPPSEYVAVDVQPAADEDPRPVSVAATGTTLNEPFDKYVVEMDVPAPLVEGARDEFVREHDTQFLRYTAVTCDADEFVAQEYQLRQTHASTKVDLLICITMYNEPPEHFVKTIQGVQRNLRQLLKMPEWSPDDWRRVLVVVVSDGRAKIHPDTLTLIGLMGGYQDGVMKKAYQGLPTQAHLFEVTTMAQFHGDPESGTKPVYPGARNNEAVVPLQLLFCLKEQNKQKISSHRWFFNAFAQSLKPEVCLLIDVGTKPLDKSIYYLWRVFNDDAQVGGACGEIAVEGTFLSMLKPITAAQNFEYKMSNVLDKPLESAVGYISVLPGAFSAYRWAALEGVPLREYFKGETLHRSGDVVTSNMYLAEDRVLCFELVAKKGCNWVLRYEKNSVAVTDAPDTYPEFIQQRRRWLNGSTFAFLAAFGNLSRIVTESGHSVVRKTALVLEFFYMIVQFLFSFVALAHFYLALHFLVNGFLALMDRPEAVTLTLVPTLTRSPMAYHVVGAVLRVLRPLYVFALCVTFLASLGNVPSKARGIFLMVIALFAIEAAVMLTLMVISTWVQFQINPDVSAALAQFNWASLAAPNDAAALVVVTLLALGATYGVFFLSSCMYWEFYHPIANILQYTILLPSYINVLQIYAYCNISDLSWGTKQDTAVAPAAAAGGGGAAAPVDDDDLARVPMLPASDYLAAATARFHDSIAPVMAHQDTDSEDKKKAAAAAPPKQDKDANFREFRTVWLVTWVFVNGCVAGALLSPATMGIKDAAEFQQKYLLGLSLSVLALTLLRFAGSLVFWLGHMVGRC
ncbi:hypothetical protein AMAG_17040 [Allomyces macrogynus ATCC 38327]|uniref:chitin synthase n=1 Tax=Allomyces macrogynus (strain ATCC 38327) TaxID=578462 RepID=A0A0L0TCY3_ALLM3|nr:hypothetical protein AMAG_17040 [Allomyces macrogynus ATCC 38327]|eukprot:KNE72597.1 hypothetical protein AMAG_17040 [Allomyces macrogynus ATCC 38327]